MNQIAAAQNIFLFLARDLVIVFYFSLERSKSSEA